jgi:uncharacterized protein GlcG (DUF336 family)
MATALQEVAMVALEDARKIIAAAQNMAKELEWPVNCGR